MNIKYSYNGKNLKDYGVFVSKGRGFIGSPRRKEPKKYEWSDESGFVPDLINPVYEARTITLECFIVAESAVDLIHRFNAFTSELIGVTSLVPLVIEVKGQVVYIGNTYTSAISELNKTFSEGKNTGTFTITIIDPVGGDVFGYRYIPGQADDRVEAVNDVAYDYAGLSPSGSKRARLLDKLRPYQCNHDGTQREYLQDDVRRKVGYSPSDLTNPLKLQFVRIPHLYYRSFEMDGYRYVLFCEQAPEVMGVAMDMTGWKEIKPCGYPRYQGVRKQIDGVWKLLSFSGENPTVSVSLTNFQSAAKNTNPRATVTPYFMYEAIVLLMVLDMGRFNAQLFFKGITDAGASHANAAVNGVTDVLATHSGEVEVEYETGKFTKQFRWRFIEGFYGQIWKFLTGIYYRWEPGWEKIKVYVSPDFSKINVNNNFSEYMFAGETPKANGYVKEFIPGTIISEELGGSSTAYKCDYNYTNADATSAFTYVAVSGGHSGNGAYAGPFYLHSRVSVGGAYVDIGASVVLPD